MNQVSHVLLISGVDFLPQVLGSDPLLQRL